ncbi:hypothetical protein H2199_004876 [Coniosporium tulheliwenetii]|uniref:Uncharacterized protein n=1 Tax=Coniosporium tulheliwenetii TaxID=3383036 RepID=A0ACC2Z4K8_9PEZI|nr:hypothetical protein H2199_004876 [Cladosporium sp. JES 115]
MVSASTICTLVVTLGPFVIPKVIPKIIAFVRSVRSPSQNAAIRPVTPKAKRAINILTFAFAFFLIASFPSLAPENIFQTTQSRLIIPNDVLFARLSQLRPLTLLDEALKAKFVSLESRLLYLRFGPDVLGTCTFCNPDDEFSYLYYALPMLLLPHLANLIVVGLATSSLIGGSHASRWRNHAVTASLAFLVTDIYLLATYDHSENKTATTLGVLDFFFWRMRTLRYVMFLAIDTVLGLVIWASSTNRAFVKPLSAVERQEHSVRMLEAITGRLMGLSLVLNAERSDMSNGGMFGKAVNYWMQEDAANSEVYVQPEVVQAMQNAKSRINLERVELEAKILATGIIRDAHDVRTSGPIYQPPLG